MPASPSDGTRSAVSSADNYKAAQHTVDWLSDHDFPVEHVSIVGTGANMPAV